MRNVFYEYVYFYHFVKINYHSQYMIYPSQLTKLTTLDSQSIDVLLWRFITVPKSLKQECLDVEKARMRNTRTIQTDAINR